MENIEKRLARIEAHLFGKTEQTQEQPKPKFEDFYVDCTREEYPEVKSILEAQGYWLWAKKPWNRADDCVIVNSLGQYFPYLRISKESSKPTLTLAQLREKYGVQPPPPLPDEPKKYEGRFTHADLDKYAKIIEETAMAWREIHKQLTSK